MAFGVVDTYGMICTYTIPPFAVHKNGGHATVGGQAFVGKEVLLHSTS